MDLVFCHLLRLANSMADALAKQGVDPRVVLFCNLWIF